MKTQDEFPAGEFSGIDFSEMFLTEAFASWVPGLKDEMIASQAQQKVSCSEGKPPKRGAVRGLY